MKTKESRFQVHDELTAPERSLPVLKGALATGGQLPNFLGVLAGSPAALRGYTRFRAELRHGTLATPTLERISLAVAEHFGSEPGLDLHRRVAQDAGLALDDIAGVLDADSIAEWKAIGRARLEVLEAEIERLRAMLASKRASRAAADAFFKKK